MTTEETYLGDGVYASFDGYQVWLRTGEDHDNRIALEPEVLGALEAYVARLRNRQHERDANEGATP